MATSCPSAAPCAPDLFQILIRFLFIWRKQINNSNCSSEREAAEGWSRFNLTSACCLGHAVGWKLCSDGSFAVLCSSSVLLILGINKALREMERTVQVREDGHPCKWMSLVGPDVLCAGGKPETPKG